MNYGQLLSTFFHDEKVSIALLLVLIDFILGVAAAFKLGNFRMSYVMDFLRNDILFKLLPYFVLYSAALLAGHETIVIPGLDLGVVAGATFAGLVATWVASILSSIKELGLAGATKVLATAIASPENAAPPKD